MVGSEALPDLNVDGFADLIVLLERVRSGEHTAETLRPLEKAIEDCFPWMVKVLELEGPQPAQRAEMEKGKLENLS
jgi:hypothetical protein